MADVPGIRFEGFVDDWKRYKFEEVIIRIGTGLNPRDNFTLNSGGNNYYVTIKNFEHGHLFLDESCDKVDDETLKKIQKRSNLCVNDILFASIGRIGDCYLIKKQPSNWNINESVFVLRPNLMLVEPEFIYHSIHSDAVLYQIISGITGSTFKSIKIGDLKKVNISAPSKTEQKQIAVFISTIDNFIALHQQKYDKLINIKKSMLEKMFPKNGLNVPEVRFKGFTDNWEQRKLGNVLISLQNNTLSRADLSNETGVAKNIHYGDVLIRFGEVLDVSKENLPMITDEKILSKYKASFLQNGDVIVADTAEDTTVGRCSEIAGLNDEVVLSGLHTIPYRPIEKFATGYLGYYLNSEAYHNQLIPLMQGIKVTSISKSAMQDTDIVYPKSMNEQAMIGDYFQSLDHLITLHHCELEKLQNIKKALLEKMFV